ncbi:MAG: class I SAM-dependent methyltransferase [Pseudomonadales bacterium]
MPRFKTVLSNGLRYAAATALATCALQSNAEMNETTAKAVDAAVASDVRSAAEKTRDRNRMPKKTLAFFGLENDMTVVEIFPGGGWYTKILAPVLAEDGQYIAAGGLGKALGFGEVLAGVGEFPGKEQMKVVDISGALSNTERFGMLNMKPESLGTRKADLVLTFRNLHNLTAEGRKTMYQAAFKALKKSGRFGVIDHTRRHMESTSDENWRRLDPVMVIQEATDAGFQLVDFANLHYRPDDELRFEVGRKSVTGNTDRFTLLFEKQ